jgi:tetratricopeptide (TPR) repeat protein
LLLLLVSCSPSTEELYSKAEKLQEQKEYKKAIEVYTKISKGNSKFQDAIYSKAYCYFLDSNYKKALHFYEYLLRVKGYTERDNMIIEQNVNIFESREVIGHEVPLAEVFYQIGVIKYYIDSLSSSYKYLQRSIDRNYEVPNCYLWQGLIWTRVDSLERACSLFQRAKYLEEPDADRLINLYCQDKKIK